MTRYERHSHWEDLRIFKFLIEEHHLEHNISNT